VKPYRRVVVGTDGSERANEAVRQAAQLAAASGARLTVVTAFTPATRAPIAHEEEIPDEIRWRITDSAEADEKAAEGVRIAQAAGVRDVRARAEKGDAAAALIEVAEDTGADVIVVGSKGLTGASRFLLGSVPNAVTHHAPCDVLIVDTMQGSAL
jgi:nucleotide-binding universal stress UspA family protein